MMTPTVDSKSLRHFGITLALAFWVVLGLIVPWIWSAAYPLWPWVVGTIFLLWSLIHPSSLRPVFHGWMALATVLGWINTRLILGLVYYIIMLPAGMIMRLIGRDPMARRFDTGAPTYRVSSKPPSRKNMEKPF